MNRGAYDRLPRPLKSVIDANSGQPAAGMAGAMWDVEAAGAVALARERGDAVTVLPPKEVVRWRKSHRAGDRGVAEADERAPDRRRQAPRRYSRAVGKVCGRTGAAAATATAAVAARRPEQKVVAQPQPRTGSQGRAAKAAAPALDRYAGRQTSAGGRVAAEGARYSAVASHVPTGYRQAALPCGRAPYSPLERRNKDHFGSG